MIGGDRRCLLEQVARFGVVGIINTAFSYGIYCLFLYVGLNYAGASFLALCAGIFWSFVTNGTLVFRRKLKGRFPRYVLLWCILYSLNLVVVSFMIGLGISDYLAGFAAIAPTVIAAFCLQRWLVFTA